MKRKPVRRFPAEPLALADVEALRAACSRRAPTGIRNRALLAVPFRSGLRISEALALFPKDLDPVGRSVRVLHGKGNKARTAPLPTFEPAVYGLGRVLGERGGACLVPLAVEDADRAARGIEVLGEERQRLGDPEPRAEEHRQEGAVADTGRRATRAGGAERLHVGER